MVRDELMRELSNGRRSPEMVCRRKEGMGSSGQVVGRPDLTSRRISSGERGEKGFKLYRSSVGVGPVDSIG